MTALVSDSSGAVTNPQAFVDVGYVGCMRYISPGQTTLTRAECERDWEVGLLVGCNWETTADAWKGGAEAGKRAGARANAKMDELQLPDSVPIYFTPVDEGGGSRDLVRDYLNAAKAEGPRPIGDYWGVPMLEQYFDEGVIEYGWIAAAYDWSKPRVPYWHGQVLDVGRAHLLQLVQQPIIGGTKVDVNIVLKSDWGGYHPDKQPAQEEDVIVEELLIQDLRTGRQGAVYLTDVFVNPDGTRKGSHVGVLLPDADAVNKVRGLGVKMVTIKDNEDTLFLETLGVAPCALDYPV